VSSRRRDYLITTANDNLACHEVGSYAVEKYRLVGSYADMFANAMKDHWDCRVYVDLFSGPGHAVIRETGQRVLTSPLITLSVPHRFDKYVFCDQAEGSIDALRRRVERMAPPAAAYRVGNANLMCADVASEIPEARSDFRVLTFCFVDPFSIDLHFSAIAELARGRSMDFMILLALGMDANRNWQLYTRAGDERVDRFLGVDTWRPRWREAERRGHSPVRFLAEEYSAAMARIGYRPMAIDTMSEIRMTGTNVPLYYLAFFSRHELGLKFWREAQKASRDQLALPL
jgi:three-Cys-motif partner protein